MTTTHDLPTTERAWVVERRGNPETALTLKRDYPVPSNLAPGEVLVKVQAAALNPVGYKLMKVPNFYSRNRPYVAENDFAGVVVDPGDSSFSVGDDVFGFVSVDLQQESRQGALADYVRVPATHIVHRPPFVTPVQAAGITLAAETAWEGLVKHGQLEEGQTVLINGGSSAVGSYAIQIAKAKGAKVYTSASGRNEGYVKNLGADVFLDYTAAPLHIALARSPPPTKFHIIFDAVGVVDPSLFTYSPAYLAPGGTYITTGPMPHSYDFGQIWLMAKTIAAMWWPTWLGGVPRGYKVFLVKHDLKHLEALQKLLAEGKLRPMVDSTYDFDNALEAFSRLMSRKATGKVVVKVDPEVK